jgi:hypothetical protein
MSKGGCAIVLLTPIVVLLGFVGWTVWRVSDAALPPLAKSGGSTSSGSRAGFNERVRSRYAVGSSEARMVADLRAQGFHVVVRREDFSEARLGRFIGCGDMVWLITWRATRGKLTDIQAVQGADCL